MELSVPEQFENNVDTEEEYASLDAVAADSAEAQASQLPPRLRANSVQFVYV